MSIAGLNIETKHLRSSVWKYFGFYTSNGKITRKEKMGF